MASVGSALLDEIERVSAKRERWRAMEKAIGSPQVNFAPAIFMMTQAIDAGKIALQGDNPVDAIRALESLQGFDNE